MVTLLLCVASWQTMKMKIDNYDDFEYGIVISIKYLKDIAILLIGIVL